MKQWYIVFSLIALVSFIVGDDADQCSDGKKQSPTRPCQKNKLSCVRKYFQNNADCKKNTCGRNIDLIHLDKIDYYEAFFNLTIAQKGVTTRGLGSGEVIDFIVDYETDILILSVQYKNININTLSTNFIYYRSAQLPKVMKTRTHELYPRVIITSYFYGAKNPQLSNSFHVANVTDLPIYDLGPCATNSKDPVVMEISRIFDSYIGIAVQETYEIRSRMFQSLWIQLNVCNYEIDIK